MQRIDLIMSRTTLVMLGLALGYLARIVFGPPASETRDLHQISPFRPTSEQSQSDASEETREDQTNVSEVQSEDAGGLVPPIVSHNGGPSLDSSVFTSALLDTDFENDQGNPWQLDPFEHDPTAIFHPHGEQLCASGCAASRHPTEKLTQQRFVTLIREFAQGPLDESNAALEELLYFGRQSGRWLEQIGSGDLPSDRAQFLANELRTTHVVVEVRVVDETGQIRSWLEPTYVPFDRRHVFDMKTKQLQPLVTSGTVKRVGLRHCWTRL